MKGKIILGSLIVLFLALVIVLVVQNVTAAPDCSIPACHQKYYDAINSKLHAGSDACTYCHTGYNNHNGLYIGYIVNETNTCSQAICHSNTSGYALRPVFENHSSSADCTQCHFANTTRLFPLNTSLYEHDHNFTVEYNFYNYNLSGMPLKSNNGVGKGMFPYYTCTLTCHDRNGVQKIDEAANSWNQSKHARSIEEPGTDNNMSCAKCKSPTNYNVSTPDPKNTTIAASNWQGIQCRVCHNIHDRKMSRPIGGDPLAYYNATASSLAGSPVYETVHNATELCEKCHTGSSHDSKFAGTHKDAVGFDCASCHLNTTFNKNETHMFEVKNTTSGVEGCEVCHDSADHTWQYTSKHTNVECWACHDQTVVYNASSGNATSSGNTYGIWNDPSTGNWTTYKVSHGAPAKWVLHNITKSVSCDKCHIGNSTYNGTIGPAFTCSGCHSSYASAVNSSQHNQTLNANAPVCTDCHAGYVPSNGHTTGTKGYIVNGSNTCTNCHNTSVSSNNRIPPGFDFGNMSTADCTQCHFPNTTTRFSMNTSLYAHDHNNLTVEHNYYYYNQSGTIRMPLKSNGGVGEGQFPFWSCTQFCHGKTSTFPSLDNASITWLNSKHAQSLVEPPLDQKISCAKCKSPVNYNDSATNKSALIPVADWQGIQCRVCHDIMNISYSNSTGGKPLAFYNATATSNLTTNPSGSIIYDQVHNATELCEKCHQPGSSHDSKYAGTHKNVVGFSCADCHLNTTSVSKGGFNNKSHSFEVMNVYTSVTGCEVCHSASDHNSAFQFTSNHTGKVTCEACHDKTVAMNATGYAVSSDNKNGLYLDSATTEVSSWKGSAASPSTWPLHNISRDVSCNKCHGTKSAVTLSLLAPTFGTMGCIKCHPSYASAVNNSMHNKTKNVSAPDCTDCHTGYDTQHNGYTGYIVNESNACRNCHINGNNGFYEEHTGDASKPADCTQCHFANTTKSFSLNASLYTHDHNLTVEYNFYNYNISGMPLSTNGGVGKGMFPYYTCTLTCHNGTGSGQPRIENETSSWNQSAHARSLHMSGDNKQSCAKCKSPANYNASASSSALIAAADWQGIQCRVCHNMHNVSYSNSTGGKPLAFYNSTASSLAGYPVYEAVPNATVLCENCHTGSSHDSKYGGTHKDVVKFDCADCHANSTFNNATHLFEVKNTTSGATGCEVCHDATSAHSNFIEFSIHGIVTCEACHDNTVAKNSSDFVVNVSVGMDAGLYKDTSTNEWTTYKVSHGSPATWPLHNISKSIDCNKCHGARSVYSGAIAPSLISGGTTYYTTDTLVSGYNLILLLLNPNPTLYAGNLLYTSPLGIPGVTKVLKWDSAGQTWVSYQYIVPSSGVGFYYGTNSTMDGYKAYFIKGNATTAGKTYTFVGTK
jgi:hypothetical protein